MKIAFIHYHLKTGGVTTVLRQQVEAVRDTCKVLVITGEPTGSSFPADIVHIPELGYDRPSLKEPDPEKIAESIIKAIFLKFKGECDVLHVHNPTLAKNKNFLKILKALQKSKIALFLQIHDFAEDGRPLSYFYDDEYISDSHYGVINSRDYEILLKTGLKKEGLHKIFNMISPFNLKKKAPISKERVLYPIRAIRRKNIGEAILLSIFFRNKETLSITLPPNSQTDIISYNGWKSFVKEKNLKVEFEAGLNNDFEELVLSSGSLITTSITEGFGLSFLEPWTGEKLLWGRKLVGICDDFEQKGIQLDHLYTRLFVPLEWIGKKQFYEKWSSCIIKSSAKFTRLINEEKIERAFTKIAGNGNIDFGLLDEAFQKQIISLVLSGKEYAGKLIDLNPYLAHPGKVLNKENLIQGNRTAILNSYKHTIYKKKLLEIYSKVANNPVRQIINKNVLLSQFFNLEEFSLLKWGNYIES